MKIGERLLLVFVSIIFIAVMVMLAACVWNTGLLTMVAIYVSNSIFIKIAISAVLLLFAILAARAAFAGVGGNASVATLAATTGEGGIYINIDTISDLASKAVRKVEGVKEIRVKTAVKDEGANIAVKVSLATDTVIPTVSAEIQQAVKADVEMLCGIKVKKVIIQVDNSLQAQK